MAYRVALINFEGPLDLLLQLVEQAEVNISEISLASVTDQYLSHIRQIDVTPDELNEFMELASRLILVKSQALIAGSDQPDEQDVLELTEQLARYRHYRRGAEILEQLLLSPGTSWTAARAPQPPPRPLPPLNLGALQTAFQAALSKLPPRKEEQALRPQLTQAEVTKRLLKAVDERRSMTLEEMIAPARDRLEAIMIFLSLLELIKSRRIRSAQDGQFGNITLSYEQT